MCTYLNVWEEPDCLMCAHPRLKSLVHVHVPNSNIPSSFSSCSSSSSSSAATYPHHSAQASHQPQAFSHQHHPAPSHHQQHQHHHHQQQSQPYYHPSPPSLQQLPPPYYHPPHMQEPDLHGDWNKKKPPPCEDGLPPCPNGQNCTIRTSAHTNMFSHFFIDDQDVKVRGGNHFRKRGSKPHNNFQNNNNSSNGGNSTLLLLHAMHNAPSRSISEVSSPDFLMDVSSLENLSLTSSSAARLSETLSFDESSLLSRHVSIPDSVRACSEEAMDPIMLGRSASACANTTSSLPSPILLSPPRSHTEPTRSASPPPLHSHLSLSEISAVFSFDADDPSKIASSSKISSNNSSSGGSRGTTPVSQKRPFLKSLSLTASRQTIGNSIEDPEVTQEKFWQAIEGGDSEAVGVFLNTSEHLIKSIDAQGNTPLIRAATLGHIQLVSYLLDHGASVNESNKDGFTPLLAAALNGQEATVQLLLDLGTDVDQRCKASYTALHCACFRGHLATVKLLVERNANMEHIAKGGMTPLLFSGFAKHAYTVQYLVSQGADVKVCDAFGRSLLDFAASNSDIKFAIETGMQLWQHRKDEEQRKKIEEAKKKQKSPKDSNIANSNNGSSSSNNNKKKQAADKGSSSIKKQEVKNLSMDISSWTEEEVRQWLDEQNFSNYATSFCENMINGEMLLSLTESELEQDLKIENRLHRRRLLLEIGKLAVKAQANQNLGRLRGEPDDSSSGASANEQSSSHLRHSHSQSNARPIRAAELPWQQKPAQEYGTRLLSSPHPAGIAVFQSSDFSDVHLLAKGEFSMAFAATLTTRNEDDEVCQDKVVIKLPNAKPGPNEWNELNTFLHVPKHPCILPFLGICKDFQYQERKSSFCIITKRQAGSIKDVLINSKHSEFDLPVNKLRVIHDFVSGLAHLHAHNVIHRDIASRNILISYSGSAVVCDFGLSRSIDPQPDEDFMDAVNFKETYYRVDQQHLLPVRWMAPESLNSGKFSRKSDVWMMGVTIWQVLTSCDQKPYESLATANQVIITVCTGQGGPLLLESLTHLPACLHALRDLVSQCLQVRPSDRPTMAQCCHLIKSIQDSINNNANNLPASLSDLTGWPKGSKPKPFIKLPETPTPVALSAVPQKKINATPPAAKSQSSNWTGQHGRRHDKAAMPVPKNEKNMSNAEIGKAKLTNSATMPTTTTITTTTAATTTNGTRSGKLAHVNKPTTVVSKPSQQSKKVADYDEVLVPEFDSEDEEPG